MQYQIHTKGQPSQATVISRHGSMQVALAAFEENPSAWAIIPAGRADELEPLGNLISILPRYNGGSYALRCGGGMTTLGFEYAERMRAGVAEWLADEGALSKNDAKAVAMGPCELPGSVSHFRAYKHAMALGAAYNERTGRRCPLELTPQLIGLEGKRVRVTDRNGERRSFVVGRSMGWIPCHLEITRGSDGGPAVYGAPFSSVEVLP